MLGFAFMMLYFLVLLCLRYSAGFCFIFSQQKDQKKGVKYAD